MAKQETFDKILRFFAKKAHVVDPKMRPHKFAPLELIVGQCSWVCHVSGAARSQLQGTMWNGRRTSTCLQTFPTRFCTLTPKFSLVLDVAHIGVLYASMNHVFSSLLKHEVYDSTTLHPYLRLAICLLII